MRLRASRLSDRGKQRKNKKNANRRPCILIELNTSANLLLLPRDWCWFTKKQHIFTQEKNKNRSSPAHKKKHFCLKPSRLYLATRADLVPLFANVGARRVNTAYYASSPHRSHDAPVREKKKHHARRCRDYVTLASSQPHALQISQSDGSGGASPPPDGLPLQSESMHPVG